MNEVRKPELFKLIEKADECLLSFRRLHVVSFEKYKDVHQKGISYSRAAESFIKRQRGA